MIKERFEVLKTINALLCEYSQCYKITQKHNRHLFDVFPKKMNFPFVIVDNLRFVLKIDNNVLRFVMFKNKQLNLVIDLKRKTKDKMKVCTQKNGLSFLHFVISSKRGFDEIAFASFESEVTKKIRNFFKSNPNFEFTKN